MKSYTKEQIEKIKKRPPPYELIQPTCYCEACGKFNESNSCTARGYTISIDKTHRYGCRDCIPTEMHGPGRGDGLRWQEKGK